MSNVERSREIERDARAWSRFSGMKYSAALRLMEDPLVQGILGERICARDVIRVLTEHPLLSDPEVIAPGLDVDSSSPRRTTHLGRDGLRSTGRSPLVVAPPLDYVSLVLTAEVLRAFDRTDRASSEASSYNLKHTAEDLVGEYLLDYPYVPNGYVIWAAAALGIEIVEAAPGGHGPNSNLGLSPDQVDYARRMRRSGDRPSVRAHHHRPPGYLYLREALRRYRDDGEPPTRWDGVDAEAEPRTSPFHEWLVAQVDVSGEVGVMGSRERLAGDYLIGAQNGEHGIAVQPEDLLSIFHAIGASSEFFDSARDAVVEWAQTSPLSTGIRTELVESDLSDHYGWGAGAGDTERYEYRCPCGVGKIVEEHDNVPGFREHDVLIDCDSCRASWDFVLGLSVRDWRLVPLDSAHA